MSADTAPAHAAKSRAKGASADVANEAAETLTRTTQSLNQIAGEYASVYSDDIVAAIETGTESARLFTELGRSYLDACTTSAQTFAEIGRDAMSCRTPTDVVNLQKRSMESMNASVEATMGFYSRVAETWTKALNPFVARIADGPQRLFRAFAD